MRIKIDKENDTLYFRLDESAIVESEEVQPGIILDYDANGRVVGMEMLTLIEKRVKSGTISAVSVTLSEVPPLLRDAVEGSCARSDCANFNPFVY